MKLGLISLGCAKNKIDSELFLGVAKKYNLEITNQLENADILVVNTCGFIESAKKEAIDTILEVLDYKKNKKVSVVAMGCLVERYLEDLKESIPEVDFYFPIKDYEHIDELFCKLTGMDHSYKMDYKSRAVSTIKESVYLRIAEGCDNKCAYCAIPLIRGKFISRPFDSLIEEAKVLVAAGAKEITLIAQDTTRYGTDFSDKDPRRLHHLIQELSKFETIKWIRVLYLYPDEITKEVLDEFKNNPKLVKYFDIPIQHCNTELLKRMNRRGSKELILEHIQFIRTYVKDAIIRTTLITGFPGETNAMHEELKQFVKDVKFERMGSFTYSREEDTKAYDLTPKVQTRTANKRNNELMALQHDIALAFNKSLIGNIYECIIEGYDENEFAFTGRNYMYAPDDADGLCYIYSPVPLDIGMFVKAKVIDVNEYDLLCELVEVIK